ncbi:neprilysin-1-like [Ruditapes philippinarum]|uniref:neprilysin-1-like n=1 Tax=Ruditapes philippinarum TaxID=129788 RepID=UPI00295BD980|nr:neprilysin-1-like [Ruditapes philippinarum]XP_060606273.1 neprilysin-1-like [Ruditapes philippinarum]
MNQDAVEEYGLGPIKEFIVKFGGWPVLGSQHGGRWSENNFSVEDLLVESVRQGNSMPLIHFSINKDLKQSVSNIIILSSPWLGMPSREYYLTDRESKYITAYQRMLEESYVAFGADPDTAADAARDVVDFEIEIANITIPLQKSRNPKYYYNKMTVRELINKYKGIDWLKLINGTMNIVGMSINESEQVLASSRDYFEKIGNVLAKYPSRVLANYLVGRIILNGDVLFYPKTLKDIYLRFKQVFSGASRESPRWRDCADLAKNDFPEVVGRLFVEEAFGEDAQKDVLELVENLRTAFLNMVDDSTWLDDVTKQTAKEKAESMETLIGYPAITFNDVALETYYENATVDNGDPFGTKVSIDKADNVRMLQTLRQPYDRARWYNSAASVNAFNMFLTNQMVYPAAILQPPYYSYDQPEYLNYGGIGSVIGHEITHGFDDRGRHFDKNGQLVDWWTTYDETEFNKRKQCLVDQYNNFTVSGTDGMKINGELTAGENIADNGGSKESFKAYRNWVKRSRQGIEEQKLPGLDYTPNQLFFLNEAQVWCGDMKNEEKIKQIHTDPHSYFMFRVVGPLQNSVEFSKAWNCPIGSYMNPPDKCSVW